MPRGTPGVSDDARPFTPKGGAKFSAVAKEFAPVARRPDALLTSPQPRARATVEVAARAFKRIEPTIGPALAHERLDGIVAALGTQPAGADHGEGERARGQAPLRGAVRGQRGGGAEPPDRARALLPTP